MTLKMPDLVAAASIKAMCALVDGTKGNLKLKRRLTQLDVKADRILAAFLFELLDRTDHMETRTVKNWKRT